MTLVLHGMRIAAHAPTPAFNLHDHYMLAGAVLTAVRAIDGDATSVEVGSFAGHTAIFSASLLQLLGVGGSGAKLHSVEASKAFAISGNIRRSKVAERINTTSTPAKWPRGACRCASLFFEDSRHDDVTKQSFDVFEPSLLPGGIVVMEQADIASREGGALLLTPHARGGSDPPQRHHHMLGGGSRPPQHLHSTC